MRMYYQKYFIIGLLVEFVSTTLDPSYNDVTTQEVINIQNEIPFLFNESPNYNSSYPCEPQREIKHNVNLASAHVLDGVSWLFWQELPEETVNSIGLAARIPENQLDGSTDYQELGQCALEAATDSLLSRNYATSEEFRAQLAKDCMSLKHTLPPNPAPLTETFTSMNSRVILPSVDTIRWFTSKDSDDENSQASLLILHCKCALAYHTLSEDAREIRERVLFETLFHLINRAATDFADIDLSMLAMHRRHISRLANHIIYSATGLIHENAQQNGQNCAEDPTFNYLIFDLRTQSDICLCFAVQLLVSGFFSYIPDTYFSLLQNVPASYGASLVSYVLGPGHAEVFPEFITAFYIIRGGMCMDAKSPTLLEYHKDLISHLPPSMRFLYGNGLAAQLSHLRTLVTACAPALHALGAREFTEEDDAYRAATEKASVYWHALSALAPLSIPVLNISNAVDKEDGIAEGTSSATKLSTPTNYFVQLLRLPVANTASLSCWTAVLEALTYAMPSTDVYAFMVAHTPAAFAGLLLRCEVVNPAVYVMIVSLWLAFKMPHTDSIAANVDAMCCNPVYLYKAQLLTRQPISFFARAPPEILYNICNALFEQIHIRTSTRHRRERLKKEAKGRAKGTCRANKRKKCEPQTNASAALPNEATRSWSDEDSEDIAHAEASHAMKARNQKDRASTRQINVQDDDESFISGETFIGDNGMPLSTLYLNMCIHRRTLDDITEEEIAYLMDNKRALHSLIGMCIAIANEIPQMQSLNGINYHAPFLEGIKKALLEIFGAPMYPDNYACASASGTSGNACERCQSGSACAGASEASTDGSNGADRTVLTLDNPASRASQDGAVRMYDISWDRYANCKQYVTTLPAFFARQLLPAIIDLICVRPNHNNRRYLFKMAGYILDTDELASSMQLLERTLGSIAADLQKQQQDNLESANITAERVDKALPDMPRFVLKSSPAISLSLEDMELRVQRCVSSNFLDARAYMEISDALHRLVFKILSIKNFAQAKVTTYREMHYVFMQIVRLLPGECPFVYQASRLTKQAPINCTWSPFFRAPPSRASPTIVPDEQIVRAIKNMCRSSVHALANNILVEEWLKLSTWIFTRSAVQSLIASQALLQPVHGEGIGRAFAAAIAHCLEDTNLLIASLAEDKAKKATNVTPDNSNAEQLIQADTNRGRLCLSLKSRLTKLISLSNRLMIYK